jgi:hypothetical protein
LELLKSTVFSIGLCGSNILDDLDIVVIDDFYIAELGPTAPALVAVAE